MMNEDLPYEQQMKPILASYDRLVSENQEERIKAAHKAEGELNNLRNLNKNRVKKLEWIQKTLEDYLVSLGIELPQYRTVSGVVKMIVKI